MENVRKRGKKAANRSFASFDLYLKEMEPASEAQEPPSEYYLLGSRAVDSAVVEFQEHRSLTSAGKRRS